MGPWREAALAIGTGSLLIAFFCWIFYYIIGLKSPPTSRAIWTVTLAYICATVAYWSGSQGEYVGWTPFVGIPGAIYAYLTMLSEFKKAWINDQDNLPEDINLANDDWKHGVARILFFFVFFAIIAIGGRLGQEFMQSIF